MALLMSAWIGTVTVLGVLALAAIGVYTACLYLVMARVLR